jgi:hypothetical protein
MFLNHKKRKKNRGCGGIPRKEKSMSIERVEKKGGCLPGERRGLFAGRKKGGVGGVPPNRKWKGKKSRREGGG